MKKGLIWMVLALTFIACEKETFVEYTIINQTSDDITVSGKNKVTGLSIFTHIAAGENSQVAIWSRRSLETSVLDPYMTFGDELIVVNADGDTMTKSYLLTSNWKADIQSDKRSADHVYTFTVTDDDF